MCHSDPSKFILIIINSVIYNTWNNFECMTKEINSKRRDFLFTATYTIGAVGLGCNHLALG